MSSKKMSSGATVGIRKKNQELEVKRQNPFSFSFHFPKNTVFINFKINDRIIENNLFKLI